MDFGALIVKHRDEQGLSQRALAQKVGIRQATLTSIERGGEVKLSTAHRILSALGQEFEVVAGSDATSDTRSAMQLRRREIQRMQQIVKQRQAKLSAVVDGLSAAEIRRVREINLQTNTGYLAELWDEFLRLNQAEMQQALTRPRFKGMAWQSLLQANPFIVAGVGSWA